MAVIHIQSLLPSQKSRKQAVFGGCYTLKFYSISNITATL